MREKKLVHMELHERPIDVGCRGRNHTQWEQLEELYEEKLDFKAGKAYGILGENAEGGGGISWLLSGRGKIEGEKIVVFNKEYHEGESVEEGWYMEIPEINNTAREQILKGLEVSGIRLSVDEIAYKFGLTEDRLDIPIHCYSWEGWRASAAIGYSFGKKIFCFPWFDSHMLKEIIMSTAYLFYVEQLKRSGAIVILPADNREILSQVTDEMVELNNPRYRDLRYFNEYMREYREKKLPWQNRR